MNVSRFTDAELSIVKSGSLEDKLEQQQAAGVSRSHGEHFPICRAQTNVTQGGTMTQVDQHKFAQTSVTPGKTQDVLTLDLQDCEVSTASILFC